MANQSDKIKMGLRSLVVVLLPLGLWAMLWLSISSGSVANIFNPGNFMSWLSGLRAIFPLAAAWVAVVLMLAKLSQQRPRGFRFFGPLGLTALYGLVGIAASLLSPDGTVALYWAAAYLSVPLVLWAIVWGADSPGQIRRIIQFNWLIIFLAVVVLFAYALLNRDLGSKLLNPSLLLECQDRGLWIGHVLRSTGVGRYAAIAAIIALSMLWQPRWRFLSGLLLLASLVLLLTTGARGSFVGFAVAAPVVILLLAGRKAVIGGAIAFAVLAPAIWVTSAHETFLEHCALTGWTQSLVLRTPTHSEQKFSTVEGEPNSTQLPIVDKPATSTILKEQSSSEAQLELLTEPVSLEKNSNPTGIFTGTGRTQIWSAGWEFIKQSPVLGYGFHADRLVLGAHIHNSILHALIQTGLTGTIPFVVAILFTWLLLLRALRNLNRLETAHKTLVTQIAGILTFLSVRALPESTGAFFGVDWLLLSPLLLYLHMVNVNDATKEGDP